MRQLTGADCCPEDLLERVDPTDLVKWLSLFAVEAKQAKGACYTPVTISQLLGGLLRFMRSMNKSAPNFMDKKDTRLSPQRFGSSLPQTLHHEHQDIGQTCWNLYQGGGRNSVGSRDLRPRHTTGFTQCRVLSEWEKLLFKGRWRTLKLEDFSSYTLWQTCELHMHGEWFRESQWDIFPEVCTKQICCNLCKLKAPRSLACTNLRCLFFKALKGYNCKGCLLIETTVQNSCHDGLTFVHQHSNWEKWTEQNDSEDV